MDFKRIQKMVHQLARQKGWHDLAHPRSDAECIMLAVCELAEAVEEIRSAHLPVYYNDVASPAQLAPSSAALTPAVRRRLGKYMATVAKPEGTLIELADCVIRIMDLCGKKGWDLEKAILLKHRYNKTRPHRHGNKVL